MPGLYNGQCNSFEAYKLRGFYLRHQDFRLVLAKGTGQEDFAKDATFCWGKGLANSDGASFESVNFPGFYIRHFDYQLFLNKLEDSGQFRLDATFFFRQPLNSDPPQKTL